MKFTNNLRNKTLPGSTQQLPYPSERAVCIAFSTTALGIRTPTVKTDGRDRIIRMQVSSIGKCSTEDLKYDSL